MLFSARRSHESSRAAVNHRSRALCPPTERRNAVAAMAKCVKREKLYQPAGIQRPIRKAREQQKQMRPVPLKCEQSIFRAISLPIDGWPNRQPLPSPPKRLEMLSFVSPGHDRPEENRSGTKRRTEYAREGQTMLTTNGSLLVGERRGGDEEEEREREAWMGEKHLLQRPPTTARSSISYAECRMHNVGRNDSVPSPILARPVSADSPRSVGARATHSFIETARDEE